MIIERDRDARSTSSSNGEKAIVSMSIGKTGVVPVEENGQSRKLENETKKYVDSYFVRDYFVAGNSPAIR